MGENDIALSFTSHGTGLAPKIWKRLSSVRNEHPNGQVRSCHVKLSGSETTYTAFSVSHRIAAYQIPCQSGHRAQRRLVYQTLSIHKSLQGISSFSISAHGNRYLAKFEVSAILFGTHRDDVLPMTCTNHWWFSRRQRDFLKCICLFWPLKAKGHLTLVSGGGGECTPMSFSEMAAEPRGGSRWNFAQLMGHPLPNFWFKKIDWARSGHGAMTS